MSGSRPIGVGFRRPPETPRPGPTVRAKIVRVEAGGSRTRTDTLATEEPCEILVTHDGVGHRIAVTMRTPGNDFELAVGFLFGEGVIRGRTDVGQVSYCASGPAEQLYNQVTVDLTLGAPFDASAATRNFYTTSSCGVCGKASLEAVRVNAPPVSDGPTIDAAVLPGLPDALRARQKVFERTGGLHAAGLFTTSGDPLQVREDVGRHNAVDKLIGWLVMNDRVPATDLVLQVSGRASFEIIQKAAVAQIPIVSAVSAPSSLAVALAEEQNITLVGFLRGDSFNVYSRPSRIRSTNASSSGVSTSSSDDGGAM